MSKSPTPVIVTTNSKDPQMNTTTADIGTTKEKAMSLVIYKGVQYVLVGITAAGNARLANIDGTPVKGNPGMDKLTPVDSSLGQQVADNAANSATKVSTSGTNIAGNPGKEQAMSQHPSTAVTTAPASAHTTFREHLASRRLVSPLAILVPGFLDCLVIEDEGNFPETVGDNPLLISWENVALYGPSGTLLDADIKVRFAANIATASKAVTADSVRKYIGSFFASAYATLGKLTGNVVNAADLDQHLESLGLPANWSFRLAMDGEALIRESDAAIFGWTGQAVRRILTTDGLIKGKFRVVPDWALPAGISVLTCETKGEITLGSHFKTADALAWQPGFGLAETKEETIISLQPQVMLLGKGLLSREHLDLTAGYFRNLVDRLPAILEGEEMDLAGSNEPKGQLLKAGFNKVGLSVLASSSFSKSIVGTVTKYSEPNKLQVRPTSSTGSDRWKAYSTTEISRVLKALWLTFDADNIPARINTAATIAATLPVFDANGRVIVRVSDYKSWAKDNTCPSLAIGSRSPTGPTSGTVVTIEALPEELQPIDIGVDGCLFVFGDSPEFWASVDTPNEGGDRDDNYNWDRGALAQLTVRGLAWREKLKARLDTVDVKSQVARLNIAVDRKMAEVQASPDFTMPKAITLYETVFNTVYNKDKKPIGLRNRTAPTEGVLTVPRNRAERIQQFRDIWSGDKSPFQSAIGSVANAQKWAMCLAAGLVELPTKLVHLRDAVTAILAYEVVLSDVIDAAGKGREYQAAHNAVMRMQKTMLWIALYLVNNRDNADAEISMAPVALATAGDALKAVLVAPVATFGTGNYIDGVEIRAARRDQDGNIVTAVSHKEMSFPLLDAHHAFFDKVGGIVEGAAEQAWGKNVQAAVALTLHEYLTQPRLQSVLGTPILKWVGICYHTEMMKTGRETESRRRFAAYGRWVSAQPRSPKAIDAKLAWARRPMQEGLEAIRQHAILAADELGLTTNNVVRDVMLAYAYKFGFSDLAESALSIAVKDGDFEVKGGLPSQALSMGTKGNIAPGDALALFLNLDITAVKVAEKLYAKAAPASTVYLAIGSGARRMAKLQYQNGRPVSIPAWHGAPAFDPAAQVGRSLTDILALPGLSLAGTSGDASHPAQPDAIARIADLVSQKVEVSRNRIKAAAQADKITADERREKLARLSDMSAYDRLHLTEMMAMLNGNVTGPVTRVEIVEKAWEQADKATYQNTFLKLSFGSVEEAGDDEDCVCNDNDDFDLATDEQYAAIAAKLEFAPFEG